jgi:hypothetical protein
MDFLIFIHNKLIEPTKMQRLLRGYADIIEYKPAFTIGKILKSKSGYHLVTTPKCSLHAFGAVYKLDIKHENAFKLLDSYHGCSEYLFKERQISDLSYKEEALFRVISFKNSNEFIQAKFQIIEEVCCAAYFLNVNNTGKEVDRHFTYNFISNFLTVFPKYGMP